MRALFAVSVGILLCTCSKPPPLLEQIISQGKLRVITRNSPTTFYYGPDGPRGLEYDLVKGFAEYLGVALDMETAAEFGQILPAISDGTAHIGAAGLTITKARNEIVDFGPAYELSRQQVIYRRGTPRPRDMHDLLGARIDAVANSAYVNTLRAARRDFPGLTWTEDPSSGAEELVARVARGEIDYTLIDSNIFALLRHYHPEARVAFTLGGADSIAWALPKGAQSLRESVAAYFAEIRATGQLDELLNRYNFVAGSYDYVGSRAFMRHVESRLPRFRAYFDEAARLTGFEWRLIAAVAYQESHWNPAAVSPTGVRGMMMLTERTAGMLGVADREDARQSVIGGARYLARMVGRIPARIREPDRVWMALAAYNVGFGHLEDARVITQMHGQDPDVWDDVRAHLPLLTEERWFSRVQRGYARGDVPVEYVDNVRRYYELLHWIVAEDGAPPDTATLETSDSTTANNRLFLDAWL